jgi:hypothetical protein
MTPVANNKRAMMISMICFTLWLDTKDRIPLPNNAHMLIEGKQTMGAIDAR